MPSTTTIRVTKETRDRLNALGEREGASAGEVVARLVRAADDDRLLADAEAAFQRLAGNRAALGAYRSETRELEAGFGASMPA